MQASLKKWRLIPLLGEQHLLLHSGNDADE
jgi:hypothetical protein